jgi:protein kinase G-like protein
MTCTQPGCGGIIQDGYEPIYGTAGYQAPEIATEGPSVSSDLYTVGRALAVLSFEFKGFQGRFSDSLPDGVPLLEQQESFARLLRRAAHRGPRRRFTSAGEMAEQLTGVLREVLATADGTPRPVFSAEFSPEVRGVGTSVSGTDQALAVPPPSEVVAGLPLPLVDRSDPAAGYLATFAGHYFRLVWTVDRSCLSAAFGLARACLAAGGRPGAIAALAAVPGTSSHYAAAQIAAVRILVSGGQGQGAAVSGDDLRQADGRLGQLIMDDVRREGKGPIMGREPNARDLRFGLERSYLALARLTPDEDRRIELVDMANAIRPRTLT